MWQLWEQIKKHKVRLIAGIVILIIVVVILFNLRQFKNKNMNFSIADAKAGLQVVKDAYGAEMAAKIEQLYRTETANFTSTQFVKCGAPGMESHGVAPYYGWGSSFFLRHPTYTPIGTTDFTEGKGLSGAGGTAQVKAPKAFVVMPSVEAAMMFLAYYAETYAAQGGLLRWYSTRADRQELYAETIAKNSTSLTNSLA